MKGFFRSRLCKILVGIALIGAFVIFGIVEPRSTCGHIVFRSAYGLLPIRPAVLRFYSRSLKEFEGGFLPPSLDDFLITRLSYCKDEPEETAILDFLIRQGPGRWGNAAFHADDRCQSQMISHIMARLNEMSPQDAVGGMMFLEGLRCKNALSKGGFSGVWSYAEKNISINRSAFDAAKKSFSLWWGDGSSWPSIRSKNPLLGTDLVIHHGP